MEYAGIRALSWLINVLPCHGALFTGWLAAWFSFYVFHFRVSAAKQRIQKVFGNRFPTREINRIAWLSWRNFIFTAVEVMRSSSMTAEWVKSISDCEHFMGVLLEHCKTKRGAILATPHMGSWELAGVACHLFGVPIFSIAGRQRNPLFDKYLNQQRERSGLPIVVRGSSLLKGVIKNLRSGKVLALLPDVRMPTAGLSINFLTAKANVGTGMAMFARHAGVPIFPCIITRVGWGRHRFRIYSPIWPDMELDKNTDAYRMTREVFRIIEEAVQAEPEQWFWFNKRWVLEPLVESRSIAPRGGAPTKMLIRQDCHTL